METATPLATVMVAVPDDAMSVDKIAAVNCVAETKVVVRLLPFHLTILVPFTKPVPLTVSVKAPVPATFDGGAIEVVVGTATVTLTLSKSAVWFTFVLEFQNAPIIGKTLEV